MIFPAAVPGHLQQARASSANTYEDNFQRANQQGFGGSTNTDGVAGFGWQGDADGTHSYNSISNDAGQFGFNGSAGTPDFANAGGVTYSGGDALALFSVSAIGSVGFQIPFDMCADKSCDYAARLNTNASLIELGKRVNGSTTIEKSASFTASAGAAYWMRANYDPGSGTLKMRIWLASAAEPASWNLSWTDAGTLLSSDATGLASWAASSTTATASVYCYAFSSTPSVSAQPCGSAASPSASYAYDPAGRLTGVSDPVNGSATYAYDQANNLTSVTRHPAGQVAVLGVAPLTGPVGTRVTITGAGFAPSPAADTVKFNGTTAAVISASATSLAVLVPGGASSGAVTVTTSGGSASSPLSFTVKAPPPKPTLTGFSPTLGPAGTQVTITGTGFGTDPAQDVVTFNRTRAVITAATSASLTVTVPAAAGAGKVSVRTPGGLVTGSGDFLIPPPYFSTTQVESASRAAADGSSHKLTVATAGDIATELIDGAPGEHLSIGVTGETFPGQYAIEVYTPWWTLLGTQTFLTANTGWTTYPLPTSGTYQVDIRPLSGDGSATVTLSQAASAGSLSASGGAVTVPVGSPVGRAGAVTFAGTIGQTVTLQVSTATAALDPHLSVFQPAGSSLMFDQDLGLSASSPSASFQLPPLPMSGTYTAVLDPDSTLSGSVSVTAQASPPGARPKARPAMPATGVTAIAGRVLQLNGRPLPGVTLSVGGRTARSDAAGRFLLTGLPAGHRDLVINGATADRKGRSYGRFEDNVTVAAGRITTLGYPVWMTPLDTASEVRITSPARNRIVLTNPRVPGLEVVIPKGSVIRDVGGHIVRRLGITPIPVSQPPFPLPAGVVTPSYFTVQPGGSYVAPQGAQVIYPNSTHLPPRTRVDFWNYDPDSRGWYVYGHGSVTPDGRQVVPDPGVKVWEFTGAMVNVSGLSAAPTAPAAAEGDSSPSDGDPVDLGTGLLVNRHTDLAEPDTMPITLTRTWRQGDSAVRPFGVGQNFTYGIFLQSANQWQEADLVLPDSTRVHYRRTSSGSLWLDAFMMADPTPTEFNQSSLAWNGDGWDLTLRDGTIYVFGENEPLQSIRDPHGNQIMLTHPVIQAGGITQVTSPNGKWISLSYDNSGRVTQAHDTSGRTVSYSYDPAGNLTTVTDPAGKVTTNGYNPAGQLTSITDARNIKYLTTAYDSAGRVSTQTLANGGTYQFSYTTNSGGQITQTQVTNPNGNVRQVAFNGQGYPVSDTEATGTSVQQVTIYTRQAGTNWLASSTDPLGNITAYGYDSAGNTTSVTWLSGTASAVTATTHYGGPFNQASSVTDPLGNTTTFGYDSAGDLITSTDPLGHATTYAYQPDGQPATVTDPQGNATTYTYQLGDLASVTDPLGRTSQQAFDQAGRVVMITGPLGGLTTTAYDARNQPGSVTDPDGNTTHYTYDASGNLLTVKDAGNHTTSYAYDSMDRLHTVTDPLGNTTSYAYDLAGNLTGDTSRSGQQTTYAYDALNRLTTVSYGVTGSGSQSSTGYSYDAGSRLTAISDSAAGTISLGYDGLGDLTSQATPQGSIGYTYDAAGNVATMTVAGQPQVSYAYDGDGQLTAIAQGGSPQVGLAYDSDGRPVTTTLPGTIRESYAYDAASQLTGITYAAGGTSLGNLAYAYDAAGNQVATSGSLARVSLPATATFGAYNADDELASFNGKPLAYDANGSLTSDGSNTYTWNARGQLTGVSAASQSASFTYNGLGQRASATINGTTTGYLYDGANIVQELSGTTPTANLLSGGLDQQFTATTAAGTTDLLTDRQGSTIALASTSGTLQPQYTYDPYGGTTSSGGSASGNPFQYTGRENDGTGLYYYRGRYYSPAMGQFISQDPAGQATGPNPYLYASDNPVNRADPSGLSPTLIDGFPGGPLAGRKTGPAPSGSGSGATGGGSGNGGGTSIGGAAAEPPEPGGQPPSHGGGGSGGGSFAQGTAGNGGPDDLGPNWQPADPAKIMTDYRIGCEQVACDIQALLGGGDQYVITDQYGAPQLGQYRGYDTPWNYHVAVIKDGTVFDQFTGRYGEPFDVYRSQWQYGQYLRFDPIP